MNKWPPTDKTMMYTISTCIKYTNNKVLLKKKFHTSTATYLYNTMQNESVTTKVMKVITQILEYFY